MTLKRLITGAVRNLKFLVSVWSRAVCSLSICSESVFQEFKSSLEKPVAGSEICARQVVQVAQFSINFPNIQYTLT